MVRDVLYMRGADTEVQMREEQKRLKIARHKPYATLHDWFWQMCSLGRLERYEVVCDGRSVSRIDCVGRIFQFPFMKRGDIHIGPAFTEVAYRGRGYYQTLMLHALARHSVSTCWMIVEENNYPSVSAVAKVGFKPVAYLKQNRITKVFRVVEKIS